MPMPDRQLLEIVPPGMDSQQTMTFIQVAGMFIGSALGGNLLSPEPFRWRKFTGEMIFALMGAVALWHFGLLQQLQPSAIVVLGFSASLGMFRQLTWVARLFRSLPLAVRIVKK